MIINPSEISLIRLQEILAASVAPRPIALVSTIDPEGRSNLSPFSFFNSFSINPPVLIFSPSRRVRDNTVKHTYENLKEVPEAVINVVTYSIVEQVNLSSTEYPKEVNEFVKSGLTPIPSETVRPFGVKESPVRFECKVLEIIELGNEGGAGNLVVCRIERIHLENTVLNEKGNIDPHQIDLVGRLGENYYCRASGNAVFEVKKPLLTKGIGIDLLPDFIRQSRILSGNDLGRMGNMERLPDLIEIEEFKKSSEFVEWAAECRGDTEKIHEKAARLIQINEVWKAMLWLMGNGK
ncbi:MAG TPA: flavin reductase family protein [Bacteroidia bacterium]|nr:flavin reductase family protein [Bacteroidia bacterium]HRS57874.1 flavin reductase family protein [Bacteroidia bacterium]HRU69273.1 flavin reductase family protein [Bacteroidia bacterium]